MVGCIPEITPDKTPPDVTAKSATLSATTINQGDPLTVTVQVTAEDKRSNLKNAQIKLMMKKPGETTFSEVGSITKPFAENVKTGTVDHDFVLAGTNFDVGGTYNLKAEIWVSDVKDNTSQEPVEAEPTGSLTVQGAGPVDPTFTVTFDPSPRPGNLLPETFDILVRATHDQPDLVYLKAELIFEGEQEDPIWTEEASSNGTTQLEVEEENLHVDIGELMQKTIILQILLRDDQGNNYSKEEVYTISKTDIAFINEEWHVGEIREINAGSLGNFPEDANPDTDISSEATANYSLPFSITRLKFSIYPEYDLTVGSEVGLYIFTNKSDVFKKLDTYKRGTGVITQEGGVYFTEIEFANLNEDNAKWMAIYLEDFSTPGDNKYPWYIWKINSDGYDTSYTDIILQDFGTVEDFYEGKPINLKANLQSEILVSLDDLQIKFYGFEETKTLEELIEDLNNPGVGVNLTDYAESTLGWPTDNSWRFAVRYHVKATYEGFDQEIYDIKRANMLEDPDPETVYVISDPVLTEAEGHRWYRFDEETGVKIPSSFNDIIYYFGFPDSHTQSQHNKDLITDMATMDVSIYPEIVVVDVDNPEKVLYIADAAIGAANRWIAETDGNYEQYSINLSSSGRHLSVTSEDKDFPIFVDNTSPLIEVEYPIEGGTNKKYFGDRRPEELKTQDPFELYDRIGVPMFFYDEIEIQSGQKFRIKASDEVSLYDFAAFFTSESTDQTYDTWRNGLPAVMNPGLEVIDMPMGFDFLFDNDYDYYMGENYANRNKEDLPYEAFVLQNGGAANKVLYTDVYGEGVEGNFSIDNRFEFYENFNWSKIRELDPLAAIDPVEEEMYFNVYNETDYKEITVPSVEETYWVWLVARDRGAQDSWLFDYANDQVNIDPLADTQEVYSQDVRFNQNNRFIVEPNLNSYLGGTYYEKSDSEADAPVVVLLKVRAVSHSMDIQRLDIKEPCLVSYPNEWYSHSYNVLQLNDGEKVTEFDDFETPELLPVDVYPVFKRQEQDYDLGSKFGYLNDNPAQINPMNENEAVETEYYGDYVGDVNGPSVEAVPVVGGNNETTFRLKTHDDIRKVTLELIDKKVWTVEEYSAQPHNVLASITIEKDYNSDYEDGQGRGGYWQWTIDFDSIPGYEDIETYCSIIAKAYEPGDADFYEQWQWPIFVDTKGPEIDMYKMENELLDSQPGFLNPAEIYEDHLKINTWVEPTELICCPSTVERWVGFQVVDGGGIMVEYEKGFDDSSLVNVANLRNDRRFDLCMDALENSQDCETFEGHKVVLHAADSYYDLFQEQNINNPDHMRLLGFPGNHPSPLAPTVTPAASSSLKYLSREVLEYEDLQVTNPWHEYYTDMAWGTYDGSFLKRDPIVIPEIALFNNIDLLNGLWEDNDDITKKYLEFSLRDELGNEGTWSSWLRRKEIFSPNNPDLQSEEPACDDTELTAMIDSGSTGENIEEFSLREKAHGSILNGSLTGITTTVPVVPPAPSVTETFFASDFMAPAWQMNRMVQLIANTENNTEFQAGLPVTALYAGNPASVELEPIHNFLDIKKYLQQNGLNSLNSLVKEEEKYIYAGFNGNEPDGPVVVRLTTDDDNVDKYEVEYIVFSTASLIIVPMGDPNAFGTEVYQMEYDPSAPGYEDTATITFEATADDCPLGRPQNESLNIFYQNPETFISTVVAASSTAINVELESDLLWETKQQLMDAFTFVVNGSVLDILDVKGLGTTLTYPGRGRSFQFTVSPFSPMSSRAISDTFGGITVTIDNIIGAWLGQIHNLTSSGGVVLPTLVAPWNGTAQTNNQVTFQWLTAVNPGVYLNSYYLYIKADTEADFTEYNAGKNLSKTVNLAVGPNYSWYVVAEFADSTRLQSVTWNFGGDNTPPNTEITLATPTTAGPGGQSFVCGDFATITFTANDVDGNFDHGTLSDDFGNAAYNFTNPVTNYEHRFNYPDTDYTVVEVTLSAWDTAGAMSQDATTIYVDNKLGGLAVVNSDPTITNADFTSPAWIATITAQDDYLLGAFDVAAVQGIPEASVTFNNSNPNSNLSTRGAYLVDPFGATETYATVTFVATDSAPCQNSTTVSVGFYIDTLAPTFTVFEATTSAYINQSANGQVALAVSEPLDMTLTTLSATLTYISTPSDVQNTVYWDTTETKRLFVTPEGTDCVVFELNINEFTAGNWNPPITDDATLTVAGTLYDVNGNSSNINADFTCGKTTETFNP